MTSKANIAEIFSSIQGEGKYVGYRQIFVRFTGCNMHCRYCDTEVSLSPAQHCLAEMSAGSRAFRELINPLTADTVAELLRQLLRQPHHSISFTGGEPLLQADFIRELVTRYALDAPVFLETNGTMAARLTRLIDCVDIVSMDIKLPGLAGREYWPEHREFLQAARGKDVFVKVVVEAATTDEEFAQAVRLVAAVDPAIEMIIQPVTPLNGLAAAPPERVLSWQNYALRELATVRVIPQTHKFMGQL